MKLKDKIQQVLVARNCCRTDAIPKLPQRESSADIDVSNVDLEISSFSCFLAARGMVSKNVWRTKEPKLKQHNTNAADEVF